jgi:hypothetical protein
MRPSDADDLERLLATLDSESQNWINNEYAECGLKYDILREILAVSRKSKNFSLLITPARKIIAKGLKQCIFYADAKKKDCTALTETVRTGQFTKYVMAFAQK